MIKKYLQLSYLIFCRVQFQDRFPDNIWDKYSRKIFVYRGIRFTITQHLFNTTVFLNLQRSGLESGYGERKIQKLKALILVLGLLLVVGTVKIQKLKALILVLGLLQVVGTVKYKN